MTSRGGFDASGHLMMHGVPRFALGVYDSGGGYSTDPASVERSLLVGRGLAGIPLNVYLNYHLGNMPIVPTRVLLDVLGRHGMMYLQTGNCFNAGSWQRYGPNSFSIMQPEYVQAFAQHPAALGYYIMDECADTLLSETVAHQQQLHALDPDGITFAATLAAGYRDPSLWTNAADVLGTDPYPLYGPEPPAGYSHFIVADFVSKLRAVARSDRPVWAVLQLFQFTNDSRLPTPDEMRAHTIMAIVEGAQGLLWWDIGVNGLRRLSESTVTAYTGHLKALVSELAGLEAALLAPPFDGLTGNSTRFVDPVAGRIAQLQHNDAVEWLYSRKQWYRAEIAALQGGDRSKSGGMLAGAANVRTLAKLANGLGYVFAYNYTNQPQPVTFTAGRAELASVRESKSGRVYPVSGASWSDVFEPYGARIYILTGTGGTPESPPPTPPPPTPGGFVVAFTYPAPNAVVRGSQTVGLLARDTWGQAKTLALTVDGAPIPTPAIGIGTTVWMAWDTTRTPNGAHSLACSVTMNGRTVVATLPVVVKN